MWGRCLNDSVRKIVQNQMPAKIAMIVTILISSSFPSLPSMAPNVLQLFWILAVVDVFAVLALSTERPTPALLMHRPNKIDSLFTVDMIKHILGHVAYQVIIVLCLPLFGTQIAGYHSPVSQSNSTQTLAFNAFVFAQIFNTFNSRRLDRQLNVFDGILDDRRFLLIVTIEVAMHILIGVSACVYSEELIISITFGFISLLLGALIRVIPNEPCGRIFKQLGLLPKALP